MGAERNGDWELTLSKAKRIYRQKGIVHLFKAGYRKLQSRMKTSFDYNYFRFIKSRKPFVFQQRKYKYFYHKYNATWKNERTVEVSIVWNVVKNVEGAILEVGNVLSHYFDFSHDIVDKYEKAEGVRNIDVTEIDSSKKYDLIVSISTLEHVGWDEAPIERTEDKEKTLRAINNLRSLLNPHGKLVVTVPKGYNPLLDSYLRSNSMKFDKILCLKRVSQDNRWVETTWKDIEDTKFNSPFPFANALVVGIVENQEGEAVA